MRIPIHSTVFLGSCLFLSSFHPAAQADPYFSFSIGDAWNAEERLTIEPDDDAHYDPIRFDADFETRGLQRPPFYSLKLGWSHQAWRWEVELLHQKLYLKNNEIPAPLDHFEVTHGYNEVFLNVSRAIPYGLRGRLGIGTIVAHPDIYIRDENGEPQLADPDKFGDFPWLDDRYFIGGYALQAAVQKNWAISPRNGVVAELKLMRGDTRLPVYRGEVQVPNTAIAFLLGYEFGG